MLTKNNILNFSKKSVFLGENRTFCQFAYHFPRLDLKSRSSRVETQTRLDFRLSEEVLDSTHDSQKVLDFRLDENE